MNKIKIEISRLHQKCRWWYTSYPFAANNKEIGHLNKRIISPSITNMRGPPSEIAESHAGTHNFNNFSKFSEMGSTFSLGNQSDATTNTQIRNKSSSNILKQLQNEANQNQKIKQQDIKEFTFILHNPIDKDSFIEDLQEYPIQLLASRQITDKNLSIYKNPVEYRKKIGEETSLALRFNFVAYKSHKSHTIKRSVWWS